MSRLFISHSHDDAEAAARIVGYLESHGMPCWISSRDIPPRAIYADAIAEAMQACSACVVLLTSAANQSKAVKRELELASHYEKPFIPIRLDEVEPAAGLDYYLRNTQWVDYARDGEDALARIVAAHDLAAPGLDGSAPTPGTSPPVPAPVAPRRTALIATIVAAVLVVVAAGGWFVATGEDEAVGTAPSTVERGLSQLTGSYHWDGLDCGVGPTVTLDDNVLVFRMPGTPTYRHMVLSAQPNTGGYALRVETRVTEPPASAGEMYVLGLHEDLMNLEVISPARTDSWERCP